MARFLCEGGGIKYERERRFAYLVIGVACQGRDAGLHGAGCAVHVGFEGARIVVGRHGFFYLFGWEDVGQLQYFGVSGLGVAELL